MVGAKRLKVSTNSTMRFRQQRIQSFRQSIVEEEHLWPYGISCFDTHAEVLVIFSGFSEQGKEQHTGGKKEVQRIDRSQ